MSRCFPFPPPGYEKKPRIDELNLLKKEKHKEKKKDRDKEKEKSSTSGEKKTDVQAEGYKEEKLNHKDQNDRDKSKTLVVKKQITQLHYQGEEKTFPNSLPVEKNDNAKYVQELARRIKDDKGSGSQLVGKISSTEQKFTVQMERPMAERKENDLDKRFNNRKMDEHVFKQSTRPIGHPILQNSIGTASNRLEGGMVKPLIGTGLEEKSKPKGWEEDQEMKSTSKDRDKKNEEKSENKNKGQDKFVGSLNKNDIPGTQKMLSHLMTKDGDRGTLTDVNIKKRKELEVNDLLPGAQNITLHHIKDGFRGAVTEGNLKKRTQVEANGFLHDLESRPNKMSRADDGRKLEPFLTSSNPLISSNKHGLAVVNHKVDVVKEGQKVNGVIELQPVPMPTTKPSTVISQTNLITRARIKSPHPDSKYLSQILTVPQIEESLDFDNQEWLFKSNTNLSKKPNEASNQAAEASRVWAEALQIESADICALPYVIPY
ncbi:uncharacterized protein LOC124937804 isoform X2 [Impatiens glandulifera]|uniref:uncharacterized protein LOC124937804 isoform X2 n=1 Tax=Impatiens glandulifera TaxID=253017 RepID=UPI001FB08285|nr:uncharacterized protein LOC124937804 isoform X2 [Impatiens glandulifera]